MATIKAFSYLRVSGKGQVEGDGLTRQEAAISEYARSNGIEIVRVFREEGVSGTLVDRPVLAEMLMALDGSDSGATTILIEKMDRLARDLMVQEAIISDLQSRGFNLISVHEGSNLLSDDPTRKLVRQVLGAIAEYDKQMTVLKLKSARDRKRARDGKCEGRKGYEEIAPEIVREIQSLRRKPKGKKPMSFNQIAEVLNEKGLGTATGKPFTGNNVSTLFHRLKNR